jgi:hypothetical protein
MLEKMEMFLYTGMFTMLPIINLFYNQNTAQQIYANSALMQHSTFMKILHVCRIKEKNETLISSYSLD